MNKLTIITVCKGRLSHLKESLPSMLAQPDAEVVVVDYDCPEGTGEFVEREYPAAKVVRVSDRPHFNNWDARNHGAAAATGDILVFVDADVILAESCSEWITENVKSGLFAKMPGAKSQTLHREEVLTAASNKLEGFHVIWRDAFMQINGYDNLLEGWGVGGDVDLIDRLQFHGNAQLFAPEEVVTRCIQHSAEDRTKFLRIKSMSHSHLIGALYRTSKLSLMRLFSKELELADREKLRSLCHAAAARAFESNSHVASVDMLVISDNVEGSNYKIEQSVTTKVTWDPNAHFPGR